MLVEGRTPDGAGIRLRIDGERIGAIEAVEPDPRWPLLLPGLVDLQVNGFAGADVNAIDLTVADVAALTRSLVAQGVTAYCPTIVTAPPERILATLRIIAAARAADPLVAATVVGVHVEGPYLAGADGPRGAHDARHLRDPDPAELAAWLAVAPGLVRIVTLAPERPGAMPYIEAATAAGVVVAVGHTAAAPAEVRAAAAAGARLCTHLGNGAHAVLPRHPNYLWAQLAADGLAASFIADGHHLPADALTAMVRAKGVPRAVLVSDSVALAGCPPGEYRTPVGGAVTVDGDGRIRLAGTELLAGADRSLLQCVRWAARALPFTLADVWSMASANPAALLGLGDRGAVRVGARADLVLWGPKGSCHGAQGGSAPVSTIVAGKVVSVSRSAVWGAGRQ
jgi:N-acetylglucosamine-6-phosphate deacetylase